MKCDQGEKYSGKKCKYEMEQCEQACLAKIKLLLTTCLEVSTNSSNISQSISVLCRLFLSQLKEYLPRLDIFLKKIGHFHYKKERISHVFYFYVIGAKTIIILFLNGKIWFRNRYYLGSLKNNIWCEIFTIWDSEQQHLVQNHTFSIQEMSCTPPSPSERS